MAQQIQHAELTKALERYTKQVTRNATSTAEPSAALTPEVEAALAGLARNLTNKLMHAPTKALRDANADGREDFVEFLRTAFDLK